MKSKRLQFTGSLGFKLSALLDLPDEAKPTVYAIFAHCFTCNKNYKIFNSVNQALTNNNIAVLRFDFTGIGASQGSFADTNFSSNVSDIIAAAEFLEINYEAPQLLIGHSFGGAAAIHAAAKISSCTTLVTIAMPSNLNSVRNLMFSKKAELQQKGEAIFEISDRHIKIKKQFLDNIEQINIKDAIANLNKPYLIIHSLADEMVSIENAFQILSIANHPKNFISLEQADHLLSNNKHGEYVGNLIAIWAGQYFE